MRTAKVGEIARLALFAIAGAFLLQVPMLFVPSKVKEFDRCGDVLSGAGQTLLRGSFNSSTPEPDIEPSSTSSASPAERVPPQHIQEVKSRTSSFKPLSEANYPFVLFSAYRQTLDSIFVLGITSVMIRRYENDRPVYKCEWLPSNGSQIISYDEPLVTDAQILYAWADENGMNYVPAIVNCTFNQSIGADSLGGLLRLHVSKGPSGHWGPTYTVESVFHEKPGEVANVLSVEESKLPLKYAFCGPPMYGTTNMDWIPHWLAYHHYLWGGKAHFYFYDVGGIDTTTRQIFEPWIKAGLLTIIEALGGEAYSTWYRNQVLFINDCIYRTRYSARWTFVYDLDEMLYVPSPNTLESLLDENADAPWITFGSLRCTEGHCRSQQSPDEWEMERLIWRHKEPECNYGDPWLCVGPSGRRKFVVNPRKSFVSGVHKVFFPEEGGVNLNGSVARVHHFHNALNPHARVCGIPITLTDDYKGPSEYQLDDSIALLIPKVREFAGALLQP